MRFTINTTPDIIPVRPDDAVTVTSRSGPRGFERIGLDLSERSGETHCLVSLPALPNAFGDRRARLAMHAAYDGDAARAAFVLYVIAFANGKQASQQRIRFYAGAEPSRLILDLDPLQNADVYQLVVYADRRYRGTLELLEPHIVAGAERYWVGAGRHVVEPIPLERNWYQEEQRVVCSSPFGDHWAEMPPGWRLDEVHPAALAAADWILYAPLVELAFGVTEATPLPVDDRRRRPGRQTLLSFSAGTDSTAALTLLPDATFRYYCERAFDRYLLGSGAEVALPDIGPWRDRMGQVENLTIVPNTFELARIAAGGRLGFAHNYGYGAIGLLLADHLEAGVLAFGSVMEQVFLRLGHLFTDVVAHPRSTYQALRGLLDGAGLFLALPTGGCSEVLTSAISDLGRFSGLAISCPRAGRDGSPCGTCFKCFRKLRLEGRSSLPEPDAAVEKVLRAYPLKSATSVVYASQRAGYRHPALDRYRKLDLGFLERYFDYAVEHMLPPPLAEHARAEFARLGIRPMSPEDEWRLRTIGQVFWPESFTWARAGLTDPAASA
jgi:hypothetical protein